MRKLFVVAILLAIVSAFAWAGGWFAPHAATPNSIIDAFETANGIHPGFRRNHAKGVGIRGTFHANGNGERLSPVRTRGWDAVRR